MRENFRTKPPTYFVTTDRSKVDEFFSFLSLYYAVEIASVLYFVGTFADFSYSIAVTGFLVDALYPEDPLFHRKIYFLIRAALGEFASNHEEKLQNDQEAKRKAHEENVIQLYTQRKECIYIN